MALHVRNSGVKSGRELFKGLKNTASHLVCIRKFFFAWGLRPTSPGPGCKLLDGSILLKFLLETMLQSESFDTLDDLLGAQTFWLVGHICLSETYFTYDVSHKKFATPNQKIF